MNKTCIKLLAQSSLTKSYGPLLGTTIPLQIRERTSDEDLSLLQSIVPENVTRAVNELLMKPPPRLKPRPPGMLSNVFDDGIPSSAGEITTKINSVAHRVSIILKHFSIL